MSDSVRRRIRTAVQTTLATASVLIVVVPVLLSALQTSIPAKAYGVLAVAGAAIVGVATALVKVMTMPAVDLWLRKVAPWLALSDTPVEDPTPTE